MSNLRLLDETIVTASTSHVSVKDVFSSDYDVYKITTNNFSTVGSTATALDLRLIDVGDVVVTRSNHDYAYLNMRASSTFTEINDQNARFFDNFFGVADQSPESGSSVTYVFNPFSSTSFTFLINESSRRDGSFKSVKYIAVQKFARSMTGFCLFETNVRPFNSGVIRTYGLRVDE